MTKLNSKRKIPLDIKEYSTHIKKKNFFKAFPVERKEIRKKTLSKLQIYCQVRCIPLTLLGITKNLSETEKIMTLHPLYLCSCRVKVSQGKEKNLCKHIEIRLNQFRNYICN